MGEFYPDSIKCFCKIFTAIRTIKKINKDGTTILLVEQNVKKALEYAHRAYVFKIGEIAFEGTGEKLLKSKVMEKALLGG